MRRGFWQAETLSADIDILILTKNAEVTVGNVCPQMLYPVGRKLVIGGNPHEKGCGGFGQNELEIRPAANVSWLPRVTDARVRCGEGSADGLRLVRRGVVGDDELEIGEGLLLQRRQGLAQIGCTIIDRQSNADCLDAGALSGSHCAALATRKEANRCRTRGAASAL